jgi:hypothetical protein
MSRGVREDNLATSATDGLSHEEVDELEALIAGTETPPEPISGGFAATYVEAPPETSQGQPVSSVGDAASGGPTGSIPVPPPRPQPVHDDSRAAGKRVPLKRELIRRIEELRDQCPEVDVGTANSLRATNKAGLQRLLDELEVKSGVRPPPAPVANSMAQPGQPQLNPAGGVQQPPPVEGVRMDALMYFVLSNGVAVLENLSQQTAPYTGVEMRGAVQQIKADEADLRPLLAGVYLEHKKELAPIMTPTAVLATYMAKVGATSVRMTDEKKDSVMASRPPPPPVPERPSTGAPSGSG